MTARSLFDQPIIDTVRGVEPPRFDAPQQVILDIQDLVQLFATNDCVRLLPVQIEELFHQIFEIMVMDMKQFLTKIMTLPNFDRVFTVDVDRYSLGPLKEIFAYVAMECFFRVRDTGLLRGHSSNGGLPYFVRKVNGHLVCLEYDNAFNGAISQQM